MDGKRALSETDPALIFISGATDLLEELGARLRDDTTVGGRSGRRDRCWPGTGNEGESMIIGGKAAPLPGVIEGGGADGPE